MMIIMKIHLVIKGMMKTLAVIMIIKAENWILRGDPRIELALKISTRISMFWAKVERGHEKVQGNSS